MFLKISQTTSPEVENSRNERLPGRLSGLFSGTPVPATIWINKVYHNKVPVISSTPLHSGNGFAISDNPLPELMMTPFIDTYARCWPSCAVIGLAKEAQFPDDNRSIIYTTSMGIWPAIIIIVYDITGYHSSLSVRITQNTNHIYQPDIIHMIPHWMLM